VLTDNHVANLRAGIALAGTLLLLWDLRLRRAGRPKAHWRLRSGLLVLAGLLAGLCWWNFLHFHFGTYIHTWETYHYYLGGKYVRELGHTRLYECTVIADLEAGELRRGEQRLIRHLDTNTLGETHDIQSHPERCTAHFSAARWMTFKHDVAWFRNAMSPARWERLQRDHGYNGSPVWALLGRLLAETAPASTTQILLLTLIDPLLLLIMWTAVGWSFGWRAMCVALIYWGTNVPALFYWVGGGYLRQDWLALTVIGVCLLRRHWMAAAGAALTTAALLRIFPGLLIAGLVLKAAMHMAQRRRLTLTPAHRRFAGGCVVTLAVLVPLSSALGGGWHAWGDFLDNSWKHAGTPLTNYMGFKTLVSYEHESRARLSAPLGLEADPFLVWKEARRRLFAERRYLFAAGVAGFGLLLAWAVRRRPDWMAAGLAVGLIAVAAELTCYYYSVFLLFGLLWPRYPAIGVALCGLSTATSIIAALSSWSDERYTAMSLATIAVVVLATVTVGRRRPRSPAGVRLFSS
jgi:hypothetical protein